MQKGEIVKLFYQFEVEINISDQEKEKIRNKAISDSIWGSIMSATHDPAGISQLQNATGKGFKMGNQIVNSLEKRQDVKNEYFQVGQKESVERIKEIENMPGFKAWLSEFEVEEIKNSI
jgi:hypothetical protein